MLEDGYIGCCPMHKLKALGGDISCKVVAKINDSQELVMVNDFARETNEGRFKKSLQDRMADIASWRWVLEDLSKRLEESVSSLKYEQKAIKVVVKRVTEEVDLHSRAATKPGALLPNVDIVETAILEEFNFLKDQKKVFESLTFVTEKQIGVLERMRNQIKDDILDKNEALEIEENVSKMNLMNLSKIDIKEKKKKKHCNLMRWENRCMDLKTKGLGALSDGLMTKQQVRGARVQLTIAAQALSNKVDLAIRRRLHENQAKLAEIEWQRKEYAKDLESLQEEQMNTERSLLANMEQERVVEARLADRSQRPHGELIRDEVDRQLKGELGRVRHFLKDLRQNLQEINDLKDDLKEAITKIDCYFEDLTQVVKLDEERTKARQGEVEPEAYASPAMSSCQATTLAQGNELQLNTIKEEDEGEDDYPFKE